MKEHKLPATLSAKEILSKHTVPELISIAKKLNFKGYSGKNKSELIELLYENIIDKAFLESLLLICDRRVWDCLLAAASNSSPTPVPASAKGPCKAIADLCILQWIEEESHSMILIPSEVKDLFSQFASDGFTEQKDRSDLIDHYALAVTHLYGIISQDEFVSIFNAQNSHRTDVNEVYNVLIQHIDAGAPYRFWKEYLTHALFEETEYKDAEDLLHIIGGKRRFVPERDILLQYKSPNFYESSSASARFEQYFQEKIPEYTAKAITSEIAFACSVDASIGKALSILDRYHFSLTKENIRELTPLLVELSNHTRKWSNCGFTPNELYQQKPGSLPIRQERKIGRNEPCPCGSGKKYKKCCGR